MKPRKIRLPLLPLLAIVILAASVFRLTNLNVIEFKPDEAINLFLASRPLFGHPFPPGSTVSSIGILNPPLANYLILPFAFLSVDPKAVSCLIAVLNIMAIGAFFLLISKYYDRLTALIASLLMAFAPWPILLSRKIWAQDFIFPLTIPLFFSLHQIVYEKKEKHWITFVFFSLLLLQLHQSTIFFLVPLTLFMLLSKAKLNIKYVFVGLVLGVIPMIPYFFYFFPKISTDPQAIFVAKQRLTSNYYPIIFLRPLQLASQGNFFYIFGQDIVSFAKNFPLAFGLRRIFYLEYLLIPLGLIIIWWKKPKIRFLILATTALPIVYFFAHIEPFVHYFAILVPVIFLSLGISLSTMIGHSKKLYKIIGASLLFILLATSIIYDASFFQLLNQLKTFKGDYGMSFVEVEQNALKHFSRYKDDPHYQEMVLASYLPKYFLLGNLPVGKMLYPPEKTKAQLPLLEERLQQVPDDPRIQNELLAFYTSTPPTKDTIELLQAKAKKILGYQPILEEVEKIFGEQSRR